MRISTHATSDRHARAHSPAARASSVAGFTLIELALVLLIVGILAGVALPSLARLGRAHIDGEAQHLATMISYLHDEAALRGRTYRLTLDLDEPGYAVEVADPASGAFVSPRSEAGWDPYAAEQHELARDVRIASVEAASTTASSGKSALYFLPEDARETFTIVLEGESGERRKLEADGVTGRVAITSGDSLR